MNKRGPIEFAKNIPFKGLIITLVIAASLSLITLSSKTFNYHDEILRLSGDFITLEEELTTKATNWMYYLEKRVNNLAQRQDEFQYSTSERIRLLEERLAQSVSKNNINKSVNINTINVK